MGTLSDIGIQVQEEVASETQKTKREKVFDLIDGERGYQLRRWGVMGADGHLHDPIKSIPDFLLLMQHHLNRAIQEYASKPNDIDALEQVRKVTGLGVACMEQHETPPRLARMVENLRSGEIT